MALSDAEQAELNQLEGEVGHVSPQGPSSTPSTPEQGGGLSASEKAEMDSLEKEVGHMATPSAPADAPDGGQTTWKDHVRPWLRQLPLAGMMAGGAGGTALEGGIPGPGTILGAGVGGAIGRGLESAGNWALGDKDERPLMAASGEVGPSMAAEMGGKALTDFAAKSIGEYAPEAGKFAAQKAAKVIANIPEETSGRYMEASAPINGAPSQRDISDRLVDLTNHTDAGVRNAMADYTASKQALKDAQTAADAAEQQAGYQHEAEYREAKNDLKNAQDSHARASNALQEKLQKANLNTFADDVHGAVGDLKDKLIEESNKGYDILSNATGTIKVDPLIQHLQGPYEAQFTNGVAKSNVAGQTADFIRGEQLRLFEMTKGTNGELTPQQAKDLLKHYDTITTYKPDAGAFDDAQNKVLKNLRGEMNTQLRGVSDEYAQHMDDNVSPLAESLEKANKLYGTKERAVQTLNSLTTPKGAAIHVPVLQELSDATGKDLRGPVSDYLNAKEILKSANGFDDVMSRTNEGQELAKNQSIMADVTNPEYKRGKLAAARATAQPAIDEATQGVSSAQGKLSEAERKANLMKGINPDTVTKKQWALNRPGSEYGAEKRFQNIDQEFGTNFENDIRNRNDADAFGKDNTRGSRLTLAGAATGHGIGGVIGAAFGGPEGYWIGSSLGSGLGGVAGFVGDKYAGDAAKFMLDRGVQMGKVTDAASAALRSKQAPQMVAAMVRAGVMNHDAKGEQKWANDGFANLMKHGDDNDKALIGSSADKLMNDQKSRDLLVQASDLKPGTKAMDNMLDRVKARIGGAK